MSNVVLVDNADRAIGVCEKQKAHVEGRLHRAFSVFVFRKGGKTFELLLQKRALHKYHSGGLWTNTCCSHAELDVSTEETAQRRLKEEMGFSCLIRRVGVFTYRAEVGNGLVEHEIDHVFIGFANPSQIDLNKEEAEEFQWMGVEDVSLLPPADVTAWFSGAFEIAYSALRTSIKAD